MEARMRITTLGAVLVMFGLAVGSASAQQSPAQQSGAYCLESATGAKSCTFATMASCEAAKKGPNDKCNPNPAATTGAGSGSSPSPKPMPSPSK
jgi:hypothetical protein